MSKGQPALNGSLRGFTSTIRRFDRSGSVYDAQSSTQSYSCVCTADLLPKCIPVRLALACCFLPRPLPSFDIDSSQLRAWGSSFRQKDEATRFN